MEPKFIKDLEWEVVNKDPDSYLRKVTLSDGGILTVLERKTGFSGIGGFAYRDVETGYRATNGSFWLASGGTDIRKFPGLTISAAIILIKNKANTCIGEGEDE